MPTFERAKGMPSLHSRVMIMPPTLPARVRELSANDQLRLEAKSFEPLLTTLQVIEECLVSNNAAVFDTRIRLLAWE